MSLSLLSLNGDSPPAPVHWVPMFPDVLFVGVGVRTVLTLHLDAVSTRSLHLQWHLAGAFYFFLAAVARVSLPRPQAPVLTAPVQGPKRVHSQGASNRSQGWGHKVPPAVLLSDQVSV